MNTVEPTTYEDYETISGDRISELQTTIHKGLYGSHFGLSQSEIDANQTIYENAYTAQEDYWKTIKQQETQIPDIQASLKSTWENDKQELAKFRSEHTNTLTTEEQIHENILQSRVNDSEFNYTRFTTTVNHLQGTIVVMNYKAQMNKHSYEHVHSIVGISYAGR